MSDLTDTMRAAGFTEATQVRHPGRVLLVAPPGAESVAHALAWARELTDGGAIAVVDAEGNAAQHAPTDHSGHPFFVHRWNGEYHPGKLVARVEAAAKAVGRDGCVVVNSLSMFWDGKGGVKDIVDAATEGWKVGGPIYRDMLDDINRVDCHLVVVCRAKTEWVIEQRERNGEIVAVPRQVATEAIARTGVEFDFELVARLTVDNLTTIKCGARIHGHGHGQDWTYNADEVRDVMRAYADYVLDGVELISAEQRTIVAEAFNLVTDPGDRTRLKQRFAREVGLPEALTTDDYDAALGWITDHANAWLAGVDVDQDPPADVAARTVVVESTAPTVTEPVVEEEPVPDEGDGFHTLAFDQLHAIAVALAVDVAGATGRAELARRIRADVDAAAVEPS